MKKERRPFLFVSILLKLLEPKFTLLSIDFTCLKFLHFYQHFAESKHRRTKKIKATKAMLLKAAVTSLNPAKLAFRLLLV